MFGYNLSQIVNPSVPNPFGGTENITMVDDYEIGQAVPFWGLIQPERDVDVMLVLPTCLGIYLSYPTHLLTAQIALHGMMPQAT